MIEHTYRAAIRCGEDFITVEQKLILPPDSTDEEIATAIGTAERIFAAQQESVERQIAQARMARGQQPAPAGGNGGASYGGQMKSPEAPATEAQHRFIDQLRSRLGWSSEQLDAFAEQRGMDVASLTKAQASALIEALKDDPAPPPPPGAQLLPGFGDEPPPPEPNGDEGQQEEIPF